MFDQQVFVALFLDDQRTVDFLQHVITEDVDFNVDFIELFLDDQKHFLEKFVRF